MRTTCCVSCATASAAPARSRPAPPAASSGCWPGCSATPSSPSPRPPSTAAVVRFGARPVGATLAGLVVALVVWWRAHPPSFDRWAAPRMRTCWRRWTAYRGRRWAAPAGDCELTRDHRRTGQPDRAPRAAGAGGHAVDRHPRACGWSAAKTSRPGPNGRPPWPTRWARTGSPSPAAAPACSPWSSNGGCRSPHVVPATPHPRDSPPRSTWPRLDVGDDEYGSPFLLRPARQAPARRRRLRRGQVRRCCGTRCARSGR